MPDNCSATIQLTEFDIKTIGTSTQMLKSMINFFEPGEQKIIGLMIRIIELNMTMDYFKRNRLPFCCLEHKDSNSMLNTIMNFCPPEERSQLEMMMNMMKMQQLQNASSPMDLMSNLLTPEQLKQFKEYENML